MFQLPKPYTCPSKILWPRTCACHAVLQEARPLVLLERLLMPLQRSSRLCYTVRRGPRRLPAELGGNAARHAPDPAVVLGHGGSGDGRVVRREAARHLPEPGQLGQACPILACAAWGIHFIVTM